MTSSLEKALESVDNTLDKIKTFSRLALSNEPSKVVDLWREELSRRLLISQDALPLVYCCNDILQESKGKENEAYKECFSEILEDDMRAILREKPDSLDLIKKVLTVWSERQVFNKEYMRKLKKCLHDFREGAEDSDNEAAAIGEDERNQDSPEDIQRKALESLPLAKILATDAWLAKEDQETPDIVQREFDDVIQRVRNISRTSKDVRVLGLAKEEIQSQIEHLVRKRRCVQARLPIMATAHSTLEKAVQRAEDTLQNATEDLNQSEKLSATLQKLLEHSNSATLEVKYGTVRLLPKRERVIKQVAQGPDLSFSKERVLKEGLTAEAAVKTERPMVYHKGLQKWVPLPTGDDTDNWRD